jgi:Zn-dependent M28 family amino/carboxypeptidase
MVYIRGSEDEEGDWWNEKSLETMKTHGKGGVLVNAHYDSVSTGFGATDDGVGVVTVLQLIRYFTTPGNSPKKGVVALLNNGEEDFLNGARAYVVHPLSQFAHTFLNLEGAGAGGRATLFRTTDTEVTRAYRKSSNPYGSVVSGDGFKQGFVRSQTDYVIFEDKLGLRGLDVAFWVIEFQARRVLTDYC